MFSQYPAAYPISRPRLPDSRPHTVHATSGGFVHAEMACAGGQEHDGQVTPRASTTDVSMLSQNASKRLSRDDTAASISELIPQTVACTKSPTMPQEVAPENQFATLWSGAQGSHAITSQAQRLEAYQQHNTPSTSCLPSQQKQSSKLGRKFSRTYREGISVIKDSMNKHTPRMRRASTPLSNEHSQSAAERLPQVAPLSPSKRNGAKYPDPRVKKFRGPWGIAGNSDRKDTPAPPAFHVTSRPAPRLRPGVLPQPWQVGGESARAAAAACRLQPISTAETAEPMDASFTTEEKLQVEDLQARRERVGSNPSAADSGADLSQPDDQTCKDSVGECGDIDMDLDRQDSGTEDEPASFDFVTTGKLPQEICLQIFEYLDAPDLEQAEKVHEEWKELANETSVWRHAYLRQYGRKIYTDPAPILVGGAGVGRPNQPNQRWRDMYNARVKLEKNWRSGAENAGKAVYLSGHTDSVYCLQFDEEKIITGSRDRTIRVWDINTFQCIRVIGGPNVRPVQGPKVLRTVDYPSFHLATASVNGTAYGNNIYHTPREWHDASILCLQYDDEILVTGSSDSDLLIWDIKTYEPLARLKRHTGGVLDVALDAKHIVSCSKDSRIIIWNRKTLQYMGELTGHRGPVNAVQLRGKYLVSASGDGIARMWDIEQMKLVKEFTAKERGLAAVEFSEDMQSVLAGGNDHVTYKFDVATTQEVQQFRGHSQLVRSLWLDSANNRVVSGSYDLDLRVYDFETGQEIWRAEEWTTSWMLAAKSDYRRIVATSQDGRILIVDFGLKKGGLEDGNPIENIDLLRAKEAKNQIVFRPINWRR